MTLANQPSVLPTNKLTVGALLAPAIAEVFQAYAPPELSGPAMSALVGALIAMFVAYWVPDRANVPRVE